MLPNSAYLQQTATERAHALRGCSSKGLVRQPICSLADVATRLRQVVAAPCDAPFEPKHGLRCQLRDAGHRSHRNPTTHLRRGGAAALPLPP